MTRIEVLLDSVLSKKADLGGVFKPGTPINHQDLFTGRLTQINEVLNSVLQTGRHAILFGERGVGKTSLARIVSSIVEATGLRLLNSGTINCEKADSFNSLWRKIFRELSLTLETSSAGFYGATRTEEIQLDSLLPKRELTPDDVRYTLSRLGTPSLIVIDEVDTLVDRQVRSQLAETIKNLSDHGVETTVIMIGVADSVVELIAEHESIERALVQVAMPRMSVFELTEIVKRGTSTVSMTLDDNLDTWIAQLSQGLPHYTHSLALYAGFNAVENGRSHILVDDVLSATRTTVEKSHSLRNTYYTATKSQLPQNIYASVLRACALAPTDEFGYFPAAAIRKTLSEIMGRPYDVPNYSRHLYDFCSSRRCEVLTKRGEPRKMLFRFRDPMMQPFVILHDFAAGHLTNALIKESRGRLYVTGQS